MLKRLLFLVLLVPLALPACSTTGEGNADARKALLVAEIAFQSAVKFATAEVNAGRLKGEAAVTADKAIRTAHVLLQQARVAVNSGDAGAGQIVAVAANAVAAVLTVLNLGT
jgi:hypothetical protein